MAVLCSARTPVQALQDSVPVAEITGIVPTSQGLAQFAFSGRDQQILELIELQASLIKNAVLMATTLQKITVKLGETMEARFNNDAGCKYLSYLRQTRKSHQEIAASVQAATGQLLLTNKQDSEAPYTLFLNTDLPLKLQVLMSNPIYEGVVRAGAKNFEKRLKTLAGEMTAMCKYMGRSQEKFWREDLSPNASLAVVTALADETLFLLQPELRKQPDAFLEVPWLVFSS